jgi:hypothetical protein
LQVLPWGNHVLDDTSPAGQKWGRLLGALPLLHPPLAAHLGFAGGCFCGLLRGSNHLVWLTPLVPAFAYVAHESLPCSTKQGECFQELATQPSAALLFCSRRMAGNLAVGTLLWFGRPCPHLHGVRVYSQAFQHFSPRVGRRCLLGFHSTQAVGAGGVGGGRFSTLRASCNISWWGFPHLSKAQLVTLFKDQQGLPFRCWQQR